MLEPWRTSPPVPPSPPDANAVAWLSSAYGLGLGMTPSSPAAHAVVDEIAAIIEAAEDRGNQRRAAGKAKLKAATGAIVGGLLAAWRHGTPAYHRRHVSGMASSTAGGRTIRSTLDALVARGFVAQVPGVRYKIGSGPDALSAGRAARMWPTTVLLDLARRHGISPDTIRTDFRVIPAKAPVKVTEAVVFNAIRPPRGSKGNRGRPAQLPNSSTAPIRAVERQVAAFNAFAATRSVIGCDPPSWRRVFAGGSLALGGRWICLAKGEGNYQTMSATKRVADIALDGSHVADIDLRSSYLTIMHALLGLPLPALDDLYGGLDVPRDVAKAWVVACLGKGSPVVKWSSKTEPEIAAHDARDTGRAVMARYPFLADPADAVWDRAGLRSLEAVGSPKVLLVHRLMALEADAITDAMQTLRSQGVLALPMHDAMVVRGPYEPEAVAALEAGFRKALGIVPYIKVQRPPIARHAA